MYTKEYWHYLCDACRKEIKPDDLKRPSASFMEMNKAGRYFQAYSKKGNVLHYCCQKCMEAHFHPGKGTPLHLCNLRPHR